jgi:hypothetical protein
VRIAAAAERFRALVHHLVAHRSGLVIDGAHERAHGNLGPGEPRLVRLPERIADAVTRVAERLEAIRAHRLRRSLERRVRCARDGRNGAEQGGADQIDSFLHRLTRHRFLLHWTIAKRPLPLLRQQRTRDDHSRATARTVEATAALRSRRERYGRRRRPRARLLPCGL